MKYDNLSRFSLSESGAIRLFLGCYKRRSASAAAGLGLWDNLANCPTPAIANRFKRK